MKCPKCNEECDRDEVNVGVGIIYGPWYCLNCFWHEENKTVEIKPISMDEI